MSTFWTSCGKQARNVVIGVIVTAVLGGEVYLIKNAVKVPDMQLTLDKHNCQIATLRVNLLTLMQKTGHPADEKQLKNLLSSVKEVGNSKARFVREVELVQGESIPSVADWAYATGGKDFYVHLTKGTPNRNEGDISRIIAAATVSTGITNWKVIRGGLELETNKGTVFLKTDRRLDQNDLNKWVVDLKTMQMEISNLNQK